MTTFADKIIIKYYFYLYAYNLCLDYRKGGFNKKLNLHLNITLHLQ